MLVHLLREQMKIDMAQLGITRPADAGAGDGSALTGRF